MNDELSETVDGVLAEAERIGLAPGSIKYYASCCRTVVRFCRGRGFERLTERAVDEFLVAMDDRLHRREIGSTFRSTLEKSAGMMLEVQQTGSVAWRRRRPPSGLSESAAVVLGGFTESAQRDLAPRSVRVVLGEVRQFLGYLDRADRYVGSATIDDIRAFLVEARPRHASGMGNTVWAIKLLFRFLSRQGLAQLNVDELLAQVGPRRARALPPFTPKETGRIAAAIDTASPRGKRDYAIVRLALSTGLRCGDIVALRLDQIDWRRDEIRLVQHKTSASLTLPLSAEVGNAIVDWLLHGRPICDASEVFVRLYAPFTSLTGPTGALIMGRWLGKAGVTHQAHDGKTFHALRRTMGTRLVESGADLALTAQVLGHASVDSSRRYIALADESLRHCCLPLDGFVSAKEGLR
ncbi:MAG TPA: tyrosine-type recombinase/integrase [Arthrobacter sp.]|nr:tyrosine-type recombinase/integrase [Arthrobacter sp.]